MINKNKKKEVESEEDAKSILLGVFYGIVIFTKILCG